MSLDDFRDEDGFLHRIGAVPDLDRHVIIKLNDGRVVKAMTLEARGVERSYGIGGERVYKTEGFEIIASTDMERWKYA